MNSVSQIQEAVTQLSRKEFSDLERWFEEERNRRWEKEIEEDSQNGRLRAAYERLKAEDGC